METKQQPLKSGFSERTIPQEVMEGINLQGKTAIVTGGHSGIGLETVKALSLAGATIIVGSRDIEKANQNILNLKNVYILPLDLADPSSVDQFATTYLKTYKNCDILINNAGIMATPLMRNSHGHEMQFATNHLGHFRLTTRLWNALVASKARIVSLSSLGHRFSDILFDDPNFERTTYNKWIAYGQSKTANSLFAVHLDKLGKEHGVRAFAVHPGRITTTNLSRFMSEEEISATANSQPTDSRFVPSFVKTVEQGAATSLWAATSSQLDGKGGVYCADCNISPLVADDSPQTNGVRRWAIDPEAAEKLWSLSEKLTGNCL